MSIVFTPFTHEEMVAGVHAIAAAAEAWNPTLLVGVGRGAGHVQCEPAQCGDCLLYTSRCV